MNVKGKQKIGVTRDYKKYFKSIQGLDGHTLFERYKEMDGIVQNRIDSKYRHFLAQPEIDGDTIYWFSVPYYEKPRRLSDLQGDERARYEHIKASTLNQYRIAAEKLKSENKYSESDAIYGAIKYVNDDFVYCFDGKAVLGVWGMELRNEIRESTGVVLMDSFEAPKRPKPEKPQPEPQYEPYIPPVQVYSPPSEPLVSEEPIADSGVQPVPIKEPPFNVVFRCGGHGTIVGKDEYLKDDGDWVTADEVPDVRPDQGYEFIGWDKEPVGYVVDGDVVFTARYKEAPFNVIFKQGEHGILKGITEYRKNSGDLVAADEIPAVEPHDGYVFAGWDKNPEGYRVDGDVVFTALYKEEKERRPIWRWILDLLILLLMHILIFMLIWCFLFDKCGFNLCGCNCDDIEYKIESKNCGEDSQAGDDEGYIGQYNMGQSSGTFELEYETYNHPDRIIVSEGKYDGKGTRGNVLWDSGCVGTNGLTKQQINFNSQIVSIEVISCESPTEWMFKVNCPDSTKQTAKVEENKCGTHKTGDGRYVGNFDMGQSSGSFQFEFDTKSEPDSIVICEGKYDGVGSKGNSIYTCPCKASEGMKKRELPFNNQWINVEVIGCTSPSKWEFTINCPKM